MRNVNFRMSHLCALSEEPRLAQGPAQWASFTLFQHKGPVACCPFALNLWNASVSNMSVLSNEVQSAAVSASCSYSLRSEVLKWSLLTVAAALFLVVLTLLHCSMTVSKVSAFAVFIFEFIASVSRPNLALRFSASLIYIWLDFSARASPQEASAEEPASPVKRERKVFHELLLSEDCRVVCLAWTGSLRMWRNVSASAYIRF